MLRTVFAAAIDAAGRSTHVGDAVGQIQATFANVRAVLAEAGCAEADIVQAVAYCKTPEVEAAFREGFGGIGWPFVVAVGDICRLELVFEIEVTACPGAKRL